MLAAAQPKAACRDGPPRLSAGLHELEPAAFKKRAAPPLVHGGSGHRSVANRPTGIRRHARGSPSSSRTRRGCRRGQRTSALPFPASRRDRPRERPPESAHHGDDAPYPRQRHHHGNQESQARFETEHFVTRRRSPQPECREEPRGEPPGVRHPSRDPLLPPPQHPLLERDGHRDRASVGAVRLPDSDHHPPRSTRALGSFCHSIFASDHRHPPSCCAVQPAAPDHRRPPRVTARGASPHASAIRPRLPASAGRPPRGQP